MTPEKLDMLNNFTYEFYTQYVVGYCAAILDKTFKEPGIYITKEDLKIIQSRIKMISSCIQDEFKNKGVKNTPYPISGSLNEDETVLTLVYQMGNDFIECPFEYTITILNKNQIN